MKINEPITNTQYVLRDDQYLISRTDLKGKLTYANPAFTAVSGFDYHELVGANHNIVRHPHMPREAFADLWRTIKAGKPWSGLVKNRRKNGDYYWVFATVTPLYDHGKLVGYGSVRVKADDAAIAEAEELYRQMREGTAKRLIEEGQVLHRGFGRWIERLLPWRKPTINSRIHWVAGGTFAGYALLSYLGIRQAWLGPEPNLQAIAAISGVAAVGLGWVILMTYALRSSIIKPIQTALFFSRQIGAGNLTLPIERGDAKAELGELLFSLEIMRKSLCSIANDINGSVHSFTQGADTIAHGNQDLSERTQSQAAALEETAASMEQFASSVGQNATNAQQASGTAGEAANLAVQGQQVVDDAVTRMHQISTHSRKITEIVGMIDSIAFQTNILALNAAVEAARAGNQGRGFAVVAAEVRSLAQKSAHAARDVKALIDASVQEIDSGVSLVTESGDVIKRLVTSIESVNQLMGDIAHASQEQSTGISQVKIAMNQMDQVTQQNAMLVEDAAQAAVNLRDRSGHLTHSTSVFMLPRG
ncbi:MAG: methyl-accepting chemotaxis protein [Pigmentiphaga sp.]|nr:methyl-accepting chemotaxis protein [Pigmentiphaga sp.]